MRLATYNVENLFDRPRVMNQATWADGRQVLGWYGELSGLLGEEAYTGAMKSRMASLLVELGLEKRDESRFVILRRNRGKLLKRPRSGGIEITAAGRSEWAGSLELKEEPVDEVAMRNTAQVIRDVDADVLAVIEAEHRHGLIEFNRAILGPVGGAPYRHVMLIDGNDARGIDVGIATRAGFPIDQVRSHVDDLLPGGTNVFSRDCPEFWLTTPAGNPLVVLVNHLKSKGYGSQAKNDERRRAQAARVAEIYRGIVAGGVAHVAVVGDLNDTPGSDPLAPLVRDTDLRDVSQHAAFDDGGYPGTYGSCGARNKIDYVLLSPALYAVVEAGGMERRGMWPGVRPVRWNSYAELEHAHQAASDHAAIWVDLDL